MIKIKFKIQCVLLVLLFMVAIPLSAYGIDGQIKIAQPTSFPIVIDQPGSYVLTSNITVSTSNVNGIEIKTYDVTLDLNGFALIGPGKESGTSGNGVHAKNKSNIAVTNGVVRDFAGDGVYLSGSNMEVKDIRTYNNGSRGIYALNSIITNCTAKYNDDYGIHANYSTIINCNANDNSNGIIASVSTITNCTIYHNSDTGINASSSTVTNCTSNNNGGNGIKASYRNRIEGNNMRNNGGYGLFLEDSHNYAVKNTASDNGSSSADNFVDNGLNNYMPISGDNANYGW